MLLNAKYCASCAECYAMLLESESVIAKVGRVSGHFKKKPVLNLVNLLLRKIIKSVKKREIPLKKASVVKMI